MLVAGFDSDVRCIIYARPTKVKFAGCRRWAADCELHPERCLPDFDHSGTVHRLGFPDSIEYDDLPSTNDGMKAAAAGATKEREEKLPKECPECHFMKPSGVYVCQSADLNRSLVRTSRLTAPATSKNEQARNGLYQKRQAVWWSQIKFTSVIVRRRGNLSAMAGVLIPFRRNSANGPTA